MMTAKDKYICDQLGWVYSENDDYVELSQASPAGEDFNICVDSKNFVEEVQGCAASFDPEEHVSMWAEAKNNGVGGVPSLFDLVEDAKAIDKMLEDLACALSKSDISPVDVHIGYAFSSEADVFEEQNKLAADALKEINDVYIAPMSEFGEDSEVDFSVYDTVIGYQQERGFSRFKVFKNDFFSFEELLLLAHSDLQYGYCKVAEDEFVVFDEPFAIQ